MAQCFVYGLQNDTKKVDVLSIERSKEYQERRQRDRRDNRYNIQEKERRGLDNSCEEGKSEEA